MPLIGAKASVQVNGLFFRASTTFKVANTLLANLTLVNLDPVDSPLVR